MRFKKTSNALLVLYMIVTGGNILQTQSGKNPSELEKEIINNHLHKFETKQIGNQRLYSLSDIPIYSNTDSSKTANISMTYSDDKFKILTVSIDKDGKTQEKYKDVNLDNLDSQYKGDSYNERDKGLDKMLRKNMLNYASPKKIDSLNKKFSNRLYAINKALYMR